jgi:hypothetical protein
VLAGGAYAFVIDGTLRRDGSTLKRRDSEDVRGTDEIIYETGRGDTDVPLVETTMRSASADAAGGGARVRNSR